MSLEDNIRDRCNEASQLIADALKENDSLNADVLKMTEIMTDEDIAAEMVKRVKKLLGDFERVGGKIEVVRDLILSLKQESRQP
jgi:uncharacterized protein YigA (DUF484 family)